MSEGSTAVQSKNKTINKRRINKYKLRLIPIGVLYVGMYHVYVYGYQNKNIFYLCNHQKSHVFKSFTITMITNDQGNLAKNKIKENLISCDKPAKASSPRLMILPICA